MDCRVPAALPRVGWTSSPDTFFSQEEEKENSGDDSPAVAHLVFCEAHLVHAPWTFQEAEGLLVGHADCKLRDLHASQL